MLLEIRIENCYVFSSPIVLSLEADMRTKKLSSNVYQTNNFHVLKTVGVYGANNVGKTNLVKSIRIIRNVMNNQKFDILPNIFTHNSVTSLGMTFLYNGHKYSYDFKYDVKNKEYVYEKFTEINKDEYNNENEMIYYIIDRKQNDYYCVNKEIEQLLPYIAHNNILIYLLDAKKFEELKFMKDIFTNFAKNIDIIQMSNIPLRKTIDLLKNKDHLQEKVVDFIKNADLDLEDYLYNPSTHLEIIEDKSQDAKADEELLNLSEDFLDQLRLTSVYRGISVPSIIFDSTGTKKIVALASYIVEALEYGKILIVDELDSGLHYKLTRAIVSMFNNELNDNAQLIFTVHDINLLDCKRLLRKEQIWFMDKDEDGVFLYSLSDFTAQDGVRDTTNVIERYKKGMLGAIPEPSLINTLLQINSSKKEVDDE